MSDFAKESGHWYAFDGTPTYTIVGKNGSERNTTLRDARVLNLVPSVTTIIRCAAAPGLEAWKTEQILLATQTVLRAPEETDEQWFSRVRTAAGEIGRKAAERGTEIHAAIEKSHLGHMIESELIPFVKAANEELNRSCGLQRWSAERSFAHVMGYGGKCDLHSPQWLVDVKTKDGDLPKRLYDDQLMQLAAYRRGLNVPNARCGILYVHRDTPEAVFLEAPQSDLSTGLVMFDALLTYWQAKNNYFPLAEAA